jgi:tetratricopeptide (TPR) repeat protein
MTQTSDSITLANEDTYENLISLIENNQNQLCLIIVVCDDLTLRQQIVGRYEREARLDNIQAQRIVLGTEPSLRAGLAKLELPLESRVVVTVTGSEWLLRVKTRAQDEQSDLQKFFGYLQWTREGLREFQYPVVLWITSTILPEMSRKAPDFWSWRKTVLRFASESNNPVLPVEREYSSAPAAEAFASARVDRDDDDFIPPPAEILSEISKLAARDPGSANLATLYAKLAEIYTKRIARGEATELEQEQQQAIDAYHQAIDRYRELNKKSALANILNKFGVFLFTQSRYKEAINFYQQSLAIQRKISNRGGEVASLCNLGNAYNSLGEYQRAIDFQQQSLEIEREIGDRHGEASSLCNLGNAYSSLGEYQRAIDFYQQSLEIQREIGDRNNEASSLCNLGNAYISLGEYQRAIDFYQQSLEIQREIGDRNNEANSLIGLGNAYSSLGEYQRAIDFHQQSLKIQREIGDRSGESVSLNGLGNAYGSLGKYQRAIDFLQQSLEIQREIGDRGGEAKSLGNLGNTYQLLGEYQRAIDFHQQSLEIQREIGDRYGEAISLFNQAGTLAKYEPRRFESLDRLKQVRAILVELKIDKMVEQCDEAIYAFNQNIATEQPQSAPPIGNPRPPEDWVKRSLANDSTPRSISPQKIHWVVWVCVGLGICFILFLLRRK